MVHIESKEIHSQNLHIDAICHADSFLNNAGTIADEQGKTVTIKGTDGTVYVQGDSSYTITVDSYGTSADLSGAAETDSWSAHEVAKPEEL